MSSLDTHLSRLPPHIHPFDLLKLAHAIARETYLDPIPCLHTVRNHIPHETGPRLALCIALLGIIAKHARVDCTHDLQVLWQKELKSQGTMRERMVVQNALVHACAINEHLRHIATHMVLLSHPNVCLFTKLVMLRERKGMYDIKQVWKLAQSIKTNSLIANAVMSEIGVVLLARWEELIKIPKLLKTVLSQTDMLGEAGQNLKEVFTTEFGSWEEYCERNHIVL